MAKTVQQLDDEMQATMASRSTEQLIWDYKIGSGLSRAANDADGAAWVVALVALETELNERGVETCMVCAWPAGDHDPELCPAAAEHIA